MKVTFDSNVLDLACRPERFPKNPRLPEMKKVNDALLSGKIDGYYSASILTIEGIMRKDRADVFSETKMNMVREVHGLTKNEDLPDDIKTLVGNNDVEKITSNLYIEQPNRKPLHPEVIARMKAAKALGFRVLKNPPRIGSFEFDDPNNEYYLSNGKDDELTKWLDDVSNVCRAVEARGVGIAQLKALGYQLGEDPAVSWSGALDQAADIHQKRAIERAFGEWADADAIASHIAYGLDVFCSADVGNSNATDSILDCANRSWLTAEFDVQFMTLEELASDLTG